MVVVPLDRHTAARRTRPSTSSSNDAARVAATVDWIPGVIGAAGEAGFELLGPVAGEDQMGVGVDKAGDDGPALGVELWPVGRAVDLLQGIAKSGFGYDGHHAPARDRDGRRCGDVDAEDLARSPDQEISH